MDHQEPPLASTVHLRALADKAGQIRDLLQDLEVALLGTGDRDGLRLVADLKRAWREFRDEALLGGPGEGGPH